MNKKGTDVSFLMGLWLLVCFALVACDTSPTPSTTAFLRCPTATPGEYISQSEIRPPIPEYPNAQNVEVATPVPPAFALGTPTPTTWGSGYEYTRKKTTFTTHDDAQTVLSFYRDYLGRAGWIESAGTPSTNMLAFGYSVESTVMEANRNNRCAPTVEHGLPAHYVEVITRLISDNFTSVEVKEVYTPGY